MKSTLLCALVVLVLLPSSLSAYTVTDTRAYRVNNTTALFYIQYAFGHENHDFYLPVLATRDQKFGSKTKSVGYEIMQDDDFDTSDGTTQAIVLANLPIENGMYKIPKGYNAPLTLAVIFTTTTETPDAEYAVAVTDLPFYSDDELTYARLNPSELQYYETDTVHLNNATSASFLESVRVRVEDITYTVLD